MGTMKIKIAISTAIALSLILLLVDSFVYFTLSARLENLSRNSLANKATAIGQYYAGHVNNGPGESNASVSDAIWMNRYRGQGETIAIALPSGQILSKTGAFTPAEIRQHFTAAKGLSQFTATVNGENTIWTLYPVADEDSNHIPVYVVLISTNSSVSDYLDSLFTFLLIGSIGAILLAAIFGYIISAAAVRPLNQMIRLVDQIEGNRLDGRVNVPPGKDEIARLASTFNRMLARVQNAFEQQSRFVADASHEIRTPLTTIRGYAALLERWGRNDPTVVDKAIRVIQKESLRLRDLADDLLTLASVEVACESERTSANISAVAEEVVEAQVPLHPELHYEAQLQPNLEVAMPVHQLKRVISNLVDNATKYSFAGGNISISTAADAHHAILSVRDTGKGIPTADIPYVFERFYRVEKSRDRKQGGSGLGLSIVKNLLESFGGSIRIESEEGKGTEIWVRLPLASNAHSRDI